MSKLNKNQFNTIRKDVFALSFAIASNTSAIAEDVAKLDYIFNKAKAKPTPEQQKVLETDILLGKVCQYLKKVADRDLTLEDAYVLKNTKEKTKVEENAFLAARQHKSTVMNRANIKPIDARGGSNKGKTKGRPEGSTNAPKVVSFTAKAGTTLTPQCPNRNAFLGFLSQEAAILDAMRLKHQDMEGIEDAIKAIQAFCENVKALTK